MLERMSKSITKGVRDEEMTNLVFDVMVIDKKENLFVVSIHDSEMIGQLSSCWHLSSFEVKELSMST